MAKPNRDTIHYLAQLCRIECTPEEEEALLQDLSTILDYMEQLKEVDTTHVKPCDHVLAFMVNVTREDVVGATLKRDLFLANAPDQVAAMIRVPPILKNR